MNSIAPRLASRALRRTLGAKPNSTARISIAAGGYGRLAGCGRAAGGYGARAFSQATQLRKEAQHPSPEFNPQSTGESKLYSFEDVQKITQDPLHPATLIDVREAAELRSTGKIPGAINIPVTTSPDAFFLPEEEFEDKFGFERPPKDAELIFYCRAGVRSRAAAGLAREAGWNRTGEYRGAWNEWFENGGKVERNN